MSKTFKTLPLFASMAMLALALTAAPAWSQTPSSAVPGSANGPLTRAQVKMDRDEFLRTHHWDALTDVWSLNSGVEPPTGVMSRADVKAARDTYLSTHRWSETQGWLPLKSGSRNMSSLTRAQVQAETRQFMRTHRWDEATEEWSLKSVRSNSK